MWSKHWRTQRKTRKTPTVLQHHKCGGFAPVRKETENLMQPNDNTPEHANAKYDLAQRVILQAAILGKLYEVHKAEKKQLEKELQPGDKRTVTNEQGVKLGTASMSQPNKKAVCSDRATLLAMADEDGAEIIDALPPEGDPRHQEIIDLLFEIRPDLLDSGVSKADEKHLADKVLEKWQITGELPAGWEITDASTARMTIRKGSDKVAKASIEHMITAASDSLAAITDGKEAN